MPVPEKDLPVVLPDDLIPDGSGNPLAKNEAFLSCACPSCGKPARRETDTMDTFLDSSWYFMRYTSPGNDQAMVDGRNDYWMPMDQYIGGIEHAVLHLLYARFWTKVMRDMGMLNFDEPFTKLLCQGMVLNHIYSRKNAQGGIEYFWPEEVENVYDARGAITGAKLKSDGSDITYGGVGTMSKSKNNGVDPQSLIDTLGADTARLFVMFASPPEQTLEWSDSGVEGSNRFLRRLWSISYAQREAVARGLAQGADWAGAPAPVKDLRREVYGLLKQADYDYQRIQYNTVVSACMKMLNAIDDAKLPDGPHADAARAETLGVLLRVLYPVVPHVTWHLWQDLGYAKGWATCSTPLAARGRSRADRRRDRADAAGQRQAARLDPRRRAGGPRGHREARGRTGRGRPLPGGPPAVIVVPGKLVNVVG